MGLTVKSDDRGVKVFKNEHGFYSIGISSKDKDGNWIKGYIDVLFKKGVELENKTEIVIKNAFPVVNEYKEKKYIKLMITDFDVISSGVTDDGFINIPDGVEEEVPFY